MKRILVIVILLVLTMISFSIFLNPANFFNSIISTLEIWLYKVYPSIFTFYIMASLLINSRIINKIIYVLRPILKHLKFKNENALHLFILSVFIGNPSSSSLICDSLGKNKITIDDANDLLKCSSFLNPLFIISFMIAYNIKYAAVVAFVHILSNFIIVFFVNRKNKVTEIHNSSINFLLENLLKSVNTVIYLLLMISGVMVFANILKFSITTILVYFNFNNVFLEVLLTNIEVSLGLNTLIHLGLAEIITVSLICFVSSFGGFSIHLQVINVINNYKLKYSTFFKYRILQGFIAVMLFLIIFLIYK